MDAEDKPKIAKITSMNYEHAILLRRGECEISKFARDIF